MADSLGMNRQTGRWVSDWPHVVQSIGDILQTRVLTRVMRRPYGSDVPALIDAPMNDETLLAFYSAAAEALEAWEPRFELLEITFEEAGPDGRTTLRLVGNYVPRGHRGDRTTDNEGPRTLSLPWGAGTNAEAA